MATGRILRFDTVSIQRDRRSRIHAIGGEAEFRMPRSATEVRAIRSPECPCACSSTSGVPAWHAHIPLEITPG